MNKYNSKDLYDAFKEFYMYLDNRIESLNRVDTLPVVGARREVAARKGAAAILIPVRDQTKALVDHYAQEVYGGLAEDQDEQSLWDME